MRWFPRRRHRWLLVIGLAVVLLVGTGFAALRVELEGEDLGDKLASILNKQMRGRIEIGSVEWPTSALKKVVTGGWVPLIIRDVTVWDDCALSAGVNDAEADEVRVTDPNTDCTPDDKPDPDPRSKRKPRKLLLKTPLLTVDIDIHAIMFGNHDFVFKNLWVRGGDALLEQTREPYPLHAYDRTIVSIVTAFYPRMKAGFRAGIYADTPPPIFDLRDIHVKDLNLTVHLSPFSSSEGRVTFGMTARIEGVDIDADAKPGAPPSSYLYMDATDPLVKKFYVRVALTGRHGRVRIFDAGPRTAFHIPGTQGVGDAWAKGRDAWYDIELSDIVVHRLAQLPKDWARKDYVANDLELDLSAHTVPCKSDTGGPPTAKDGAELHVAGELSQWWDRPYDGTWDLALEVKNLGPTLRTCINRKMGGDNLGGTIALSGPFIALPKVHLELHDLDFDVALSKQKEPIRLTLAEVHGDIDLVNDEGSIEKTKALVRGGKDPGEVLVSATFGVKPLHIHTSVDITKPIDVGRFLPDKISTSVGRFLAGKLTVDGDVDEGFALEDFDLTLGTTPKDQSIRVHHGRLFTADRFDTIKIQKVYVEAGRSHALFDGVVDTVKGLVDVKIDGDFPDLDMWLRRFGLPAFAKSAGGGSITIKGPLTNVTVAGQLNLGGVPCLGAVAVNATMTNSIAQINSVSSAGLGGSLTGRGTVVTGAVPLIENFHLSGRGLDGSKLCGSNGLVKGTIDTLEVELTKTPIQPRSAIEWLGYFTAYADAQKLSVMGDPYSNVNFCVNRSDDDAKCRPKGRVAARLDSDDVQACDGAKHSRNQGFCVVTTATRDRGGTLDATVVGQPAGRIGRAVVPARLNGTIALDDVPLAVLEPFVGHGVLGGLFNATLHLQGSPTEPQATGAIDVLRGWVAGGFLGDPHLQVDAIDVGKVPSVWLHGDALTKQLQISATIGTVAPYPVELTLSGRRIEIDQFVDLSKKLGFSEPIQAWASGTVTVRTELVPKSGKPAAPEAWVEVTELEAILDHRSNDGRLTPLRFQLVPSRTNSYAMSMRVTPETIELSCRDTSVAGGRRPCPVTLDTPAGLVEIQGSATAFQMHLVASSVDANGQAGLLDLRRLAPLLENQLDEIDGHLELHAEVSGTVLHPSYQVALAIRDGVQIRPAGSDTKLRVVGPHLEASIDLPCKDLKSPDCVPGGQLLFANGSLGFNSFTVAVADEHSEDQGALTIAGTVGLDGFKPASWGLLIGGKIAGKMLLVMAPGAVSQASGLARIDGSLVLSGSGPLPLVDGSITFDTPPGDKISPLAFTPRSVRRELALLGGSVDIKTATMGTHRTYTFDTADDNLITISIDNEGKLRHVDGTLVVADGKPDHARFSLDAENIPFRIPGTLDLTISATDVVLELPSHDAVWQVSGNVAIVGGTYQRNFELTDQIKPAPATVAPPKPFWDEYPAIGNAVLGPTGHPLTVDVRRFSIFNNIAQIELEGPRILITGSPRDPRLSGSIRVQRGEFQIPLTRAKFTRTIGSIDFFENERATNPKLDLTSDAPDYHDLSGQQHVITLQIAGTLENPVWDLRTSTGYDKSQTLALLFLGRTQEQLRRSLGDQSLGADPTRVDPTTNPSANFGDQIVKDVAGQYVSDLLGDSLTKLTKLDVLRFELGFGSVGVRAEKKFFNNITGYGEVEQTIRGQTYQLRFVLKTPIQIGRFLGVPRVITNDRFTLQTVYLDKTYSDPADQAQNIQDLQAKLVYQLFIP